MAEPMLKLRGVRKRFGALEVLKGIDLDVQRGEVVCILGPSGSGKSTLLRCVNLLEPPEEGEILLEDQDICKGPGSGTGEQSWNLDFVRQRVGMVFQQFNLFPHKTALENVTMAPERVLGRSKAEAREKGTALLERVGLADKLGQYPERLSGGQQQRVAIARALAMEPHVMLFDEVTSALDPELVKEVLDTMRELGSRRNDDAGRHPRDRLRQGSRRPGRLHGRRRDRRAGPPAEVLENPREERTKQFLGLVLER